MLLESLYKQHCSIESIQAVLRHRHVQTQMHCERAVLLAEAFGKACGLDDIQQRTLHYSAMFHDVGKVGIPDEILLYEGALNDEQRVIMERHSPIGEAIVRLMQVEHGSDIACHVRHHHEHFDGSGYPDKLKGESIPLLARMLTIIDSYDAMTEMRSYRTALSHEETIAIMQSESGIVHDPELLIRFIEIEDIETIGKRYNESVCV